MARCGHNENIQERGQQNACRLHCKCNCDKFHLGINEIKVLMEISSFDGGM
jgi:hypothetical protein